MIDAHAAPARTFNLRSTGLLASGCAALAGAAVAVLGLPLSMFPLLAMAGILLFVVGVKNPWAAPSVLLVAVTLPLPPGVHVATFLFGVGFYVFDLLLPLAAAGALSAGRSERPWRHPALAFYLAVMVSAAALGVLRGVPAEAVARELRPAIYLATGFLLGAAYFRSGGRRLVPRLIGLVLAYSLAAILLSTVTGTNLTGGLVSSASTGVAGLDPSAANRFQIQSTPLAILVLSTLLCLVLVPLGARELRSVLGLLIPSAGVVFFAFSRHTVLAIGVALLVALVAMPRRRRLLSYLPALLLIAACAALYVMNAPAGTRPGAPSQLIAFQERVFGGLSNSRLQADPGVELRRREDRHAWGAFLEHPVAGLGLGAAYRPVFPDPFEPFPEGIGPAYTHNLFLGYLAKTGVLGFAAFWGLVLGALVPALRASRRSDSGAAGFRIALGAALAGFLAANAVAPYLNDLVGATLFGSALGYLWASRAPSSCAAGELEERGHRPHGGP